MPPEMVKAWGISLFEGNAMWTDDPECLNEMTPIDGDERNGYAFTEEQILAMAPGDKLTGGVTMKHNGRDVPEWTIECRMVDKEWLDNLPEFDGW